MSEARTTPVCYRHPERETYLACSDCGRPICPDCSYDAPVGQKCPECVRAAGAQRVVQARNLNAGPSFQTSPVVMSLIVLNAVIFLAGMVSVELETDLILNFAAVRERFINGELIGIATGEWWRALTAAFLHGGLMHILFNMYFLYIFGPRLEQQVGSLTFSGLYIASAAGGSLASYLFGPAAVFGVGASGALFGLFGAWLYAAYRQRGSAAGSAMFNQLGAILLINLALPIFLPNIDWRAHAGGLLTGIVIAFLWERVAAGHSSPRRMRTVSAYGVLIIIMALIVVL